MSTDHEIKCSQSVSHPYKLVRQALSEHADSVFQNATKEAASNTDSVGPELRATIAGLDLAKEIKITITNIDEDASAPKSATATRYELEWEATVLPRLFPLMKAELLVWPLNGTETQLDFVGHYEPPGGSLGQAIDSMVGRRIATLSVNHFVKDITSHLSTTLQRKPRAGGA